MAEHLFLRMGSGEDDVTAVALDSDGLLLAGPERVPLAAVADRIGERRVTVLLPASGIVSAVVDLPPASPARLRQMLPYTLEDDLAADVEDLHFASGERTDAGLLSVSVIAKSRLEAWLGTLRGVGVNAQRICTEADAVPDTPGIVTLFLEGRKILGRRAGGAAFAFDELSLIELWQLLEAERENSDDLRRVVLFIDSATLAERQDEIDAWRTVLESLDIKELDHGCLPRLASNLVHRSGANLLQGDYASRSSLAAMVRPWRTAAGFFLALIAVGLLGKAAIVWKLGGEAERLTAEIAAVCAESYSSSQINSCRLEMLRRLDAAGQTASGAGGAGYLATQATIAEAAGNAMAMETMTYRDGILSLVFMAPDVPYVEAFSQAVAQGGRFQVRDQSTTSEPDGVRTRLSIVPEGRP